MKMRHVVGGEWAAFSFSLFLSFSFSLFLFLSLSLSFYFFLLVSSNTKILHSRFFEDQERLFFFFPVFFFLSFSVSLQESEGGRRERERKSEETNDYLTPSWQVWSLFWCPYGLSLSSLFFFLFLSSSLFLVLILDLPYSLSSFFLLSSGRMEKYS